MNAGAIAQTLRNSAGWWVTLLAGAAIAQPVTDADTAVWHLLDKATGPVPAALIFAAGLGLVAVAAASALGRIRLPGKATAYRLAYPLLMARWGALELLARGHPGNGRRNPRYPSETMFIAEDPRRRPTSAGGGTQCDYGVHWRDHRGGGRRLTWIEDTGELIAVGPRKGRNDGEAPVEILARIGTSTELERRIDGWRYATPDLKWARRRAHGWDVPLTPRGKRWARLAAKPPTPWPAPPTPSLDKAEGAYVGTTGDDLDYLITVTDADGARPLYHHAEHSPTGYSWGYGGSGPHDLARSILYDRLGYVPSPHICTRFVTDIIRKLPGDFTLTYKQVDHWIDTHGQLFARNPRAQPFDPYAAGGSD